MFPVYLQMARALREEEDEMRSNLQELETYHASDDSDDESWGDKQDKIVAFEWVDFFTDQSVPVIDEIEVVQTVFHPLLPLYYLTPFLFTHLFYQLVN